MGQILIMPEVLANQIAAGEVVERPASVVKELIENSLDAGAKSIYVSLEDGGISKISVQDDGVGMDDEDARLAFSRHATSKVRSHHDLFRIATLGFRGEALAAISAVSRVTLQTRRPTDDGGIELFVEGNQVTPQSRPVGIPVGTRIEVKDLFFNTPARLKYLRTVVTEQARCVEVVHRAAMSRPDVAFRCDTNGHTVFQSNGRSDVLEVLASIYGIGEARQFIHAQGETADYQMNGYFGRPTQAKSSRAHGHLFINHRPIRNIAIHQAVIAGYQSRLMVNRHPIYCLYLEMDPTLVDVNIHPHKAEVRLSEERDLVQLIQRKVKEALDDTFLVPTVSPPREIAGSQSQKPLQGRLDFGQPRLNHPGNAIVSSPQQRATMPSQGTPSIRREADPRVVKSTPEVMDTLWKQPVPEHHDVVLTTHETATSYVAPELADLRPQKWNLRPIGQALGMYVLADDGENLYIIDQHAAHERILYEKFSAKMNEREVFKIPLLAPMTIQLSPREHGSLMAVTPALADMGLEIEDFGGYSALVRTIPDIWEGLDAPSLVEELIRGFTNPHGSVDVRQSVRESIVLKACKAAIKANATLSMPEIEAMCETLTQMSDPFHCPHGRPVFIKMSNHQLEKEFRRIV